VLSEWGQPAHASGTRDNCRRLGTNANEELNATLASDLSQMSGGMSERRSVEQTGILWDNALPWTWRSRATQHGTGETLPRVCVCVTPWRHDGQGKK